ncbi:MAG: DUF1552 domain-containing protein [bacterium]|nr:DUF1552 domain-containing protein [Gammaproteobacteria bacterium]
MMIFKKAIPRRTFLRGLGASVALPMLDSMIPALANTNAVKMPLRVGYTYSPNGIIKEAFRPTGAGANYEMSHVVKQWAHVRDKVLVLSNLNNGDAESVSGHVGGSTMFLTGSKPNKSLSEIYAGISVDQVIAKQFGKETPLESLQLCIENAAELAGQSAGGYSSAYTNTISWSSPTSPMPMIHRPRDVFERLFGDAGTNPEARKARLKEQKSILDFVMEDFSRTKKKLGARDQAKLDEFTTVLRDVEARIQKAEKTVDMELPDMQRPVGIPEYEEHSRLMYDLLHMAFQTDMTRVFTFMVAREYSELVFTNLGHTDPYHPITHHRGNPTKIRMASEINTYHARLFGEFLAKLEATKDLDGTSILDNAMLVYGAGMGNGDIHSQWNVPVALIGGGRGTLNSGRHILYEEGTPFSNLHVAMLNKMSIETESFGGELGISNGELDLDKSA